MELDGVRPDVDHGIAADPEADQLLEPPSHAHVRLQCETEPGDERRDRSSVLRFDGDRVHRVLAHVSVVSSAQAACAREAPPRLVDARRGGVITAEQADKAVDIARLPVDLIRRQPERLQHRLGILRRQRQRSLENGTPLLEPVVSDPLEPLHVKNALAHLHRRVASSREQVDLGALGHRPRLEDLGRDVRQLQARAERAPLPPRHDRRRQQSAALRRGRPGAPPRRTRAPSASSFAGSPTARRRGRGGMPVASPPAGRRRRASSSSTARAPATRPGSATPPPRADAELRRREPKLEHEDRPEHHEVVELDSVRRMRGEELPLPLREELRHRRRTCEHRFHRPRARVQQPLHRAGAHEPAGDRVHLDVEPGRGAGRGRELRRDDRPQLHDRVVALPLNPPRPHDNPASIEREVRRIEEHDLPNLRLERVHPQPHHGRAMLQLGHRQLQLDAVRGRKHREQFDQLLLRERSPPRALARLRHPRAIGAGRASALICALPLHLVDDINRLVHRAT